MFGFGATCIMVLSAFGSRITASAFPNTPNSVYSECFRIGQQNDGDDRQGGIALEKLKGIRQRVTVRRSQRDNLHSWSFFQLKSFIAYKARLAGVPLIQVDPRNTSRTCPVYGCVDKRNRPNQSTFLCVSCEFSGLADHIAAINIGSRAAVNRSNVARDDAKAACAELRPSAATSPTSLDLGS